MPAVAAILAAAVLSALPWQGAAADAADAHDVDAQTGLVKAPGWEQVRAHCGGCHSLKLVTAQRGDRGDWLAMIRWMQATQNLWQFEPAVETAILDYLASNYAPQPNRRRAPLPPWLMPPDAGSIAVD